MGMQRCIFLRTFCVLILGRAEGLENGWRDDTTAELFFSLGSDRLEDYRKKHSTKRKEEEERKIGGNERGHALYKQTGEQAVSFYFFKQPDLLSINQHGVRLNELKAYLTNVSL